MKAVPPRGGTPVAGRTCRGAAHLSVQTELLDLVDAVDHHVHEGQQRVHVFGRCVAHARHYTRGSKRAFNSLWGFYREYSPLNVHH